MLPCLRDTLSEPTLGGPPQRSGWCRAPVGRLGVFDRRDLVEVGSVNVHGVDPAAISSRTVKTIVDPSGDHVGSCAPDPAGSFPGPDADPCRPMLAPRLPPVAPGDQRTKANPRRASASCRSWYTSSRASPRSSSCGVRTPASSDWSVGTASVRVSLAREGRRNVQRPNALTRYFARASVVFSPSTPREVRLGVNVHSVPLRA
jgi:hypothetical protein